MTLAEYLEFLARCQEWLLTQSHRDDAVGELARLELSARKALDATHIFGWLVRWLFGVKLKFRYPQHRLDTLQGIAVTEFAKIDGNEDATVKLGDLLKEVLGDEESPEEAIREVLGDIAYRDTRKHKVH